MWCLREMAYPFQAQAEDLFTLLDRLLLCRPQQQFLNLALLSLFVF